MRVLALIIVGVLILISGCKDDDGGVVVCTTCPDRKTAPTLENIWPNQDQTSWTFDYTWAREGGHWAMAVYKSESLVPPLPDWSDVEDLLDRRFSADSLVSDDAVYHMRFNGQATGGGGVTAQNLEQWLQTAGPATIGPPESSGGHGDFLGRLYLARPDLRETLAQFVDPAFSEGTFESASATGLPLRLDLGAPPPLLRNPQFVHGGVWEKTEDWIGTYGDLDELLAWKFLTSDLRPGTEFSHQLIPSIASNVYLHCRIERIYDARTDVGVLRNALECYYLIDYGVSVLRDFELHVLGYSRAFGYGVVVYAPRVGPVYCHERTMADAADPVGYSDLEIDLTGSSTLAD